MAMLYPTKKRDYTLDRTSELYQGESIETKVRRITENNEPITDGAPMIYTERADGVMAGYDIRTDRWELAMKAMDKVNKSIIAKREEAAKPPTTTKTEE